VTFTGYLEGEALRKVYRCADLFVLASWTEGFPYAINEALDAGLPIITTKLRGMADHLEEGTNALFVPPKKPDELAQAMLAMVEDPTKRSLMAQANREKSKEFLPGIVGSQFWQILQDVLHKKRTCGR